MAPGRVCWQALAERERREPEPEYGMQDLLDEFRKTSAALTCSTCKRRCTTSVHQY